MKYIKKFEDVTNDDWMIDISDIVDPKIFDTLPDITETVKIGDVVIGVWFDGDFEPFLLKVGQIDEESIGSCDDNNCYAIDYAWGVFDVEEYKKLDPNFELKLNSIKYNL